MPDARQELDFAIGIAEKAGISRSSQEQTLRLIKTIEGLHNDDEPQEENEVDLPRSFLLAAFSSGILK